MTVLSGARDGRWTWLRRLTAQAAARDLAAFIVPGPEIARAHGLDLAAAGLSPVATPRHANVLVVVGELPTGLRRATAVAWAQMPRPRAILALGAGNIAPLPAPDVAAPQGQEGLIRGVAKLRQRFADGAFSQEVTTFDVAAVNTATTYTCPMHPEITRDAPGQCPICGMDLVPHEDAGDGMDHDAMEQEHEAGAEHESATESGADTRVYTCPMHPDVAADAPGRCPQCGMALVPREELREDQDQGEPGETEEGGQGTRDEAYTCPMHPEVDQDAPGSCPICGMALVSRGSADTGAQVTASNNTAYICPMHPEIEQETPGACPMCGMDLVPREEGGGDSALDAHADKRDSGQGDEPEGGEQTRHGDQHNRDERHNPPNEDAGGEEVSAPDAGDDKVAGTNHEEEHTGHEMGGAEHADEHDGHEMGGMDHGGDQGESGMGDGFMSMVMMTKDLPRSADGLPMERLDVPFGPFSPMLPGGLTLTLTLDGDTVVKARAASVARISKSTLWGSLAGLPDRLARLDPFVPFAYRLLAERAFANVIDSVPDDDAARAAVGALERERAVSHLNWLAAFADLLGVRWLAGEAARSALVLLRADDVGAVAHAGPAIVALLRRFRRTPLLAQRLRGIGALGLPQTPLPSGPVARATGETADARADDRAYRALGFVPLTRDGGDAWARLDLRLAEIAQSLDLIAAAGALAPPARRFPTESEGIGVAQVETPRGTATLRVTVHGGAVTAADLTTPSMMHLTCVQPVAEGREVADALVGVASLDLSPWGLEQ